MGGESISKTDSIPQIKKSVTMDNDSINKHSTSSLMEIEENNRSIRADDEDSIGNHFILTDKDHHDDEPREITKSNGETKDFGKSVTISCDEKLLKKPEDDDEYEMVVPDGGWGWLVLLGAMMVNILIPGGAIKSFGILFVEFIDSFEATPTQASWIPALCYFLYSSLGPLSSILSVKYSYRTVTLIGGTFAGVGMILTFWASSINYLYISYGVMVGIGAGLAFPPTVYIVTSYFSRLRGLANGLCISGSALGSIFLPPILRYLLDNFGYRGACLIMGGITLNTWIAALFYDPVEKHMKRVKKVKTVEELETDNFLNDRIIEEEEDEEEDDDEKPENAHNGDIPHIKKAKFILAHDESTPISTPTMDYKSPDIFKFHLRPPRELIDRSFSANVVHNYSREEHRQRKISTPIKAESRNGTFTSQMGSTPSLTLLDSMCSNSKLNRYHSTRASTRPKRSPSTSSFMMISTPYHGSTLSTLQPNEFASHLSLKSITSSLNPMHSCQKPTKPNKTNDDEEPSGCKKFFDLSLLSDPVYLIILISNCTNAIGYTNFIILLPAYALTLGFNKDLAAYLISIVSIFDLIGRIGGSALSDIFLRERKTWYFVGGLLMSGISLTILPFATDYTWVSVFCSLFGLASGCYVGITAIVMSDLLGTERLTSSYGISLFVNGILQLIGPPICLTAFEMIGKRYQPIFIVLGISLLLGGFLWFFMPCVRKRKQMRNNDLEYDVNSQIGIDEKDKSLLA